VARERVLIVAPSWVGDSILSEPDCAIAGAVWDPQVDVAPPWCVSCLRMHARYPARDRKPVRLRSVRSAARRRVAKSSRAKNTRAIVLLNTGNRRWCRFSHATDPYRLLAASALGAVERPAQAAKASAAAIGQSLRRPAGARTSDTGPGIASVVPDVANRSVMVRALSLKTHRPVVALCPEQSSTGEALAALQFAELAPPFGAMAPRLAHRLAER
jgi:hypothetical protein